MKLPHYALSGVLALGMLGGVAGLQGCGSYYGAVGFADEPYDYYTLGVYDGPDYVFYRDGRYYYDHHHRDDGWRHEHERERVWLDRGTHERYAREWNESRARTAGHEVHGEHHDGGYDHH